MQKSIIAESTVSGEGSIYYDIRFCASVPGNGERVRLIINVEAQKDYYPGYQMCIRDSFTPERLYHEICVYVDMLEKMTAR